MTPEFPRGKMSEMTQEDSLALIGLFLLMGRFRGPWPVYP